MTAERGTGGRFRRQTADAYVADPRMVLFYAQDDDVYQGYPVDELLSGLYGSNYRNILSVGNNKNSWNDSQPLPPEMLSEQYVTNELLGQIAESLQKILEDREKKDPEAAIQNAAQEIISAMKIINLDSIEESVHSQDLLKEILEAGKAGDKKKLSELLTDGNTVADIVTHLVNLGKYAPLLFP